MLSLLRQFTRRPPPAFTPFFTPASSALVPHEHKPPPAIPNVTHQWAVASPMPHQKNALSGHTMSDKSNAPLKGSPPLPYRQRSTASSMSDSAHPEPPVLVHMPASAAKTVEGASTLNPAAAAFSGGSAPPWWQTTIPPPSSMSNAAYSEQADLVPPPNDASAAPATAMNLYGQLQPAWVQTLPVWQQAMPIPLGCQPYYLQAPGGGIYLQDPFVGPFALTGQYRDDWYLAVASQRPPPPDMRTAQSMAITGRNTSRGKADPVSSADITTGMQELRSDDSVQQWLDSVGNADDTRRSLQGRGNGNKRTNKHSVSPTPAAKKKGRDPIIPQPAPVPTQAYIEQACLPAEARSEPQKLLVILDLNGTLIYRPDRRRPTHLVERPYLKPFLRYLFDKFSVMVWSSARPKNVAVIVDQVLRKDKEKLIAMWGRDTFNLSATQYQQRVQVYKQLSWVWNNEAIQLKSLGDRFAQHNTVLIDDSILKAAAEPYSLLQIPEFEGKKSQMENDILRQVAGYLEDLKMQLDVTCFMREHPFEANGTWEMQWPNEGGAEQPPADEAAA